MIKPKVLRVRVGTQETLELKVAEATLLGSKLQSSIKVAKLKV